MPADLRAQRFGSWAPEWVAFNYARAVALPGAKRGALPFFMHPQCETAIGRLDCIDADAFRYDITVRTTG